MDTAYQEKSKASDVCSVCGQKIKEERGVGFGADTKITCGCPDPFARSINTKGWGS